MKIKSQNLIFCVTNFYGGYYGTENPSDETRNVFNDHTFKSWFVDDEWKVKVGESLVKIMKGECETLEVRETLYGDPSNTWRLFITTDDKLHLLKSSRELK